MRDDDGVELKILRARMDMSQVEFADRFHLGLRALQSWEQGRSRPPGHVVPLIRRVLELESESDDKSERS